MPLPLQQIGARFGSTDTIGLMKQIGIIGAGIMVIGIAQNFHKDGYEVRVCSRRTESLWPHLGIKVIEKLGL